MIALNTKSTIKNASHRQKTGMMHKISLRERKHAQTKVSLAREAITLMREKRLDDISVKELCEAIPISEVTFYNYFPQKTDLLLYIMKLWQLELSWKLQHMEGEKSNLEIIEQFFDYAAQTFEEYPFVMNETLAFFAQQRGEVCFGEISIAEKLVAYPELIGIENIKLSKHPRKNDMLLPYIQKAVEAGELPDTIDVQEVASIIHIGFIGTLMTMHKDDSLPVRPICQKMLKIFWHGLQAEVLNKNFIDEN